MSDLSAERLARARSRETTRLRGRERVVHGTWGVVFVAAAVGFALFGPASRHAPGWLVPAFALAYAAAAASPYEVGELVVLPTELVLVPMFFSLPARDVPLCIGLGYVLSGVPEYVRGDVPWERMTIRLGSCFFAFAPALVFVAADEPRASLGAVPVLALAVGAQFALDLVNHTVLNRLALGVRPLEIVPSFRWVFVFDALLAPVGLLAAIAARTDRATLLLPIPLFVLFGTFARERRRRVDNAIELSNAYRGTAFLLGDVVEADDAYTADHSRQVVQLVVRVCEELGLDERARRDAEFAALLHDVGKIRIPSSIVTKPGPLSTAEWRLMQTHTIEGERLLHRVGGLLADIGTIVRSCHERWDGNGYPDGLAGEQIPLIARIVFACDAFNAMTTHRPYRMARAVDEALLELRACSGTQFDPQVVDALVAVVGEGGYAPDVEVDRSAFSTCPRCASASALAAPTGEGDVVCLRCGLVAASVA
jgi:HD-GYP domain-containing protein (c-di-GMP phosphodiesterase class II)